MKKSIVLFAGILISVMILNGQEAPPRAFSFKALITKNGTAVKNKTVYLQISVIQDNMNGSAVFAERFTPVTNDYGQVDLEIGRGNVVSGDFSAIAWSENKYFLKTEYALKTNDPFQILTITQLLSVPYALFAGEAGSAINEYDPIFSQHPASEITNSHIANWNTAFGWGNHEGLYRPIDYTPSWNEIQSKPTTIAGFGITDAVTITGDQTITGLKTFSKDLMVNERIIGRGKNTGIGNTALGEQALASAGGGYYNTANGSYALYANKEGSGNTALGYQALFVNESGSNNTAVGLYALYLNKGHNNTATGTQALYRNTDGYSNTAHGLGALAYNSTGFSNTATGVFALYSNTTGWFNTANGEGSLYSNTDGKRNTAFGFYALHENITGFGNTAVGTDAGRNAKGDNNVFLGHSAGNHETGSNKLYIDNQERENESDARTKSLIYGMFDVNPANQILAINGNVGIGLSQLPLNQQYKLNVNGNINFSGDLYKDGNILNAAPKEDVDELRARLEELIERVEALESGGGGK